ncbi:hypothetical protein WMY93_015210 [Mugilogobius chulae]|uniref:C-type lectin domain-containing protein n=1 Tax=Mugilogobius chulae TaxID=88201 RepID=A0AAW0P6G9_9GOBI
MSWYGARSYCRQNYTDLAMILDESESSDAASVVPSADTTVWIGLSRYPWIWADGSGTPFYNWAPKQPDNQNGTQHCVWMDANYQWRDENCSLKYPFVCYQAFQVRSRRFKIKLQAGTNLSDQVIYNQIIQKVILLYFKRIWLQTCNMSPLPHEPIPGVPYLADLYLEFLNSQTYTWSPLTRRPIPGVPYLADLYLEYLTSQTYTWSSLTRRPIPGVPYLADLYQKSPCHVTCFYDFILFISCFAELHQEAPTSRRPELGAKFTDNSYSDFKLTWKTSTKV